MNLKSLLKENYTKKDIVIKKNVKICQIKKS